MVTARGRQGLENGMFHRIRAGLGLRARWSDGAWLEGTKAETHLTRTSGITEGCQA